MSSEQAGSPGPLAGHEIRIGVHDVASRHAQHVLQHLGARLSSDADIVLGQGCRPRHPAEDWAEAGALWLTGRRDGPPMHPVGAPASAARGALRALAAVAELAALDPRGLPGIGILGERAAIAGFSRQGPRSVGGAFALLRSGDGWVGTNLARPSDVELIPALTEGAVGPGTAEKLWRNLSTWLATTSVADAVARAHLLGLPLVAVSPDVWRADQQLDTRWDGQPVGVARLRRGGQRDRSNGWAPLIVDLASLWAGPLASHLLRVLGARVVKVESRHRPDGARLGPVMFFDVLHAGKECVALDLGSRPGLEALRQLVAAADVVIDASRPRAMAQLGIDVEATVDGGTTWVSITGYGRTGPWSGQPAFGDDAAAAAGLVAWDQAGPVPAGDAIADPLAGVHAAVAAVAALVDDRAWLIDLAMREVALVAARLSVPSGAPACDPDRPVVRPPDGAGPAMGRDTERVMAEFGIAT